MTDIRTLLANAAAREIAEQEDEMALFHLSHILWDGDDKCKGNVLRYFRYKEHVAIKRTCFFTSLRSAITAEEIDEPISRCQH